MTFSVMYGLSREPHSHINWSGDSGEKVINVFSLFGYYPPFTKDIDSQTCTDLNRLQGMLSVW